MSQQASRSVSSPGGFASAPASTAPTVGGGPGPAVTGACPECEGAVVFARAPLAGQVVACVGCGAELEVTSREPLRLELAPEVEEDWGE